MNYETNFESRNKFSSNFGNVNKWKATGFQRTRLYKLHLTKRNNNPCAVANMCISNPSVPAFLQNMHLAA
jgi:hypothetical protein